MLTAAIGTALSGLTASQRRVAAAADNIVNVHSEDHAAKRAVTVAGVPGVTARLAPLPAGSDLVTEIVEMATARHAYEASAQVLERAGAMQDRLLDIFDDG